MPKKKIAIAISEDVLAKLDELTAKEDVSRSMIVGEAVAQYVARQASVATGSDYRKQALEALKDAEALAAEYHADPRNANAPSSLEILRAIRAEDEKDL